MTQQIILALTGHRPDKLGGYTPAVKERVYKLARMELMRIRPDILISGMALGWDQAGALAALDLRITLHCYVPFKGQEGKWPSASQHEYQQILGQAQKIVTVCEGDYASWKMAVRNERMVRDCTHVLALWNGSSGGTANCVISAKCEKRLLHNCWDKYVNGVLQYNLELVK